MRCYVPRVASAVPQIAARGAGRPDPAAGSYHQSGERIGTWRLQ